MKHEEMCIFVVLFQNKKEKLVKKKQEEKWENQA